MNQSSEWYSSLAQDLWDSVFYAEVVAHVERAIASEKGETNTRKLIGILFEIQKLETTLDKGTGIRKLQNSICKIANLLKSWGFNPTEAHRQEMIDVLRKISSTPNIHQPAKGYHLRTNTYFIYPEYKFSLPLYYQKPFAVPTPNTPHDLG